MQLSSLALIQQCAYQCITAHCHDALVIVPLDDMHHDSEHLGRGCRGAEAAQHITQCQMCVSKAL